MKARGKVAKQESDHKRDADRRPAASILFAKLFQATGLS